MIFKTTVYLYRYCYYYSYLPLCEQALILIFDNYIFLIKCLVKM